MGPEAERRYVESLFDVPEPYRSMALDIDKQMIEIEKANRMNEPWDGLLFNEQIARARAEQEARNQLYELDFETHGLLEGHLNERCKTRPQPVRRRQAGFDEFDPRFDKRVKEQERLQDLIVEKVYDQQVNAPTMKLSDLGAATSSRPTPTVLTQAARLSASTVSSLPVSSRCWAVRTPCVFEPGEGMGFCKDAL